MPDSLSGGLSGGPPFPELPEEHIDLEEWIDALIVRALEKNGWNQSRTAKYLNISRNTLVYRMEKRSIARNANGPM